MIQVDITIKLHMYSTNMYLQFKLLGHEAQFTSPDAGARDPYTDLQKPLNQDMGNSNP